ncbi:carbohydrate ABC transporter permease [Streptomyces sp. ISL-14]|nr:carbohydrate ABC transporter permease [Streptomyces sp. ISL-14]
MSQVLDKPVQLGTPTVAERTARRRALLEWIAVHSLGVAAALFFTLPFVFVVLTSLMSDQQALTRDLVPDTWEWGNYTKVFDTPGFLTWWKNTLIYAGLGTVLTVVSSVPVAYGFAKFRFRGDRAAFNLVLGAIMVPATALAIPTYLLFAKVGLVNTPWAIILPSLVNPFGLYLMRIYAEDAVPDSILEAARIDGAGEPRIFLTIALRLLAPGLVTVLLFTLVATWNNYFLPLIMLNDPNLYPITVGLSSWAAQAQNGGGGASSDMLPLVVTGSMISIVPLVIAFLLLQRYWQSGLATGGVKQ